MICHIAFDQPPLARAERVNNVKKRDYFTQYGERLIEFNRLIKETISDGLQWKMFQK